jgi:hypothetical protein
VTKRYGTIRRCVREGCGWQARLDEDEGSWVEMEAPRAAAQIRRRSATDGTATRGKKAAAKAVGTPPPARARGRSRARRASP